MVFNAIVGNDDDHPRNHAAIYCTADKRWRLSPAFDIVPNAEETPRTLSMQLSAGRFDIARDAVLADAAQFGLLDKEAAAAHLRALIQRIADAYGTVDAELPKDLRELLDARLAHNIQVLRA